MNRFILAALFTPSAVLPSTRPSSVVPDKRASASADPEPSVVPDERKRHWAPAFAGATRVWGQQLEAQAPTLLVGNWSIEFERGRRMENGEATIMMGTGKVTIEQSGGSLQANGDVLTGTLGRALPMRDEPLPPTAVKGKRIAGSSD